jgi:hypothetical protein
MANVGGLEGHPEGTRPFNHTSFPVRRRLRLRRTGKGGFWGGRVPSAWAVIGLLFRSVRALVAQEWPNFAMQIAFSSAMFLLLTGTPARWRNITAVVVYLVGYLGVLGIVILLAFLHGLR